MPLMNLEECIGEKFLQSDKMWVSYLNLIKCLILLLNDEQPDIRMYLVNNGMSLLFNNDNFVIKKPSREGEGEIRMKISVNDSVIINEIFNNLSIIALRS
jgi:hypothetical protein